MILPIYVYGAPILTAVTEEVEADSPAIQTLIDDMIETMHGASGIGLAAPQVGRSERIFVIDLSPLEMDGEDVPEGPMVFINPQLLEEDGKDEEFEEGCLSIPDIREYVVRPERIRIAYKDREFNDHMLETDGMLARVIQHEYDHLEGILFLDYLSAFKRRLLRRRLRDISMGRIDADYPLHIEPAVS